MHIPSEMMNGAVCPVTAAVAATGIAGAAWAAAKSDEKPDAIRFASVSAMIFAAQMVNFPIAQGTSGHLMGGVLAAALLGTPFGILAMALVLSIQCLLFSDGGFSVLGANVVNMSLIGAGLGGLFAGSLRGRAPTSMVRLGLAAWLSVVLASLSCSILLAVSGTVPFAVSAPSMLAIHALIGGAEALITVFAYALLVQPARVRRSSWVPGLAALVIALVLAPLASSLPDGLEGVAGKLGFLHDSAPAFVAPLSDYALPLPLPNALSTGLAGVIGVLAVFAMGTLVAAGWNSLRPARIS